VSSGNYLARLLQTSGDATLLRQSANKRLAARPANCFVLANYKHKTKKPIEMNGTRTLPPNEYGTLVGGWLAGCCCCCFYISEVSDVSDAARAAADGQPVNVIYWTDGRRVAKFQLGLPLFSRRVVRVTHRTTCIGRETNVT